MRFASLTALRSRALLILMLPALTGLYAQTTRLELGKTIPGDLSGVQTRAYSIKLKANRYLCAVVTQPVAVMLLELYAPDGKKMLEVDTRNFNKPSRIVWIAEIPGTYRLSMSGQGRYEIKLQELRKAAADDRKRAEAERLFTQGLSEARRRANDQALVTFARALEFYREVQDREREGDSLYAMGTAYNLVGQSEKAIGYHEQALAIFQEIKDRRGEASTVNGLGDAYQNLGQSKKAIGYHERALAIFQEIKDRLDEGWALKNLGNAYYTLSQYDKAIGYYEQALTIAREIKDRNSEGRALGNLGNANKSLSQYDKAIGYYEQALTIFREVGDAQGEGRALTTIGGAYADLSQYEKAIGYYEGALAIALKVNDPGSRGRTLTALGWSHTLLGQYEKAIGYYEQALEVERDIKDRKGEDTTLIDLGTTYAILGDEHKAIDCYEQALAIAREIESRWDEGMVLMNLGWSNSNLKQYRTAIGYSEQALAIAREIKSRHDEGQALNNLGSAYGSLSQYDKAIGYDEQALTIAREIKDRVVEFRALNDLGAVYRSLSQYDKAIGYHEQAVAISREVKARDGEAGGLSGLMATSQAAGRPRLAIFYGKQAVNTIQSMRSDIRGLNQDLQRSFLADNEKPYRTLAEILIAQGRLAEAEEVLALLKEEEYFQYIRRDAREASSLNRRANLTPDEAEYEKHYREVGDQLTAIGVERGGLLAVARRQTLTPEQSQRLVQLEQDLAVGNQAFERFLADLTQHFSAKPEMTGRVQALRETQGIMEDLRDLPAGTVAIFTLIGDDAFYAILRTPDAVKAYEYPIKAADLNGKIYEFRRVIQDAKIDPRPLAQELHKILIAGMADDLRKANVQTLMWSLDGALRYVPLAALYDGKQYLIEQYRLSVMTLATNARLKDRPDQEWKAAGFGVTKQHEGAPALPSVSAELAGIITTNPGDGGVLAGEVRLDGQFTQPAMRQMLLKRYPVVHIASHFQFQPGDDAQSFLMLGDGGHLSMAELKTSANLFGGVQLLTLSACNTGVGDGKEVEGFGALAQLQGAKAVIASLWPVVDESTSLLMREFYRIRETSPGITKLEALREAQLELLHGKVKETAASRQRGLVHDPTESTALHDFRHPYFWAPFFLMGNWL